MFVVILLVNSLVVSCMPTTLLFCLHLCMVYGLCYTSPEQVRLCCNVTVIRKILSLCLDGKNIGWTKSVRYLGVNTTGGRKLS